jgi:hypothetical protein
MLHFAQKEAHQTPILGFAGRLENDGIMMQVEHVYFESGQPTTVSVGWCKFFFKRRKMDSIFCGIKVEETSRRTTAVVVFKAAPGQ